jgi:class 3 adenylate cyclase/pimeloyl-ACP methyl ester carboxylesterase
MEQQIRFCTTSDGVRIAYATAGQGPPLVRAAGWFTHLELEWGNPRSFWRSLEPLAESRCIVRYDGRGMGLSDREVEDFSLMSKIRDLEAVVDALGLERFSLLGQSEGGPTAIAYTVRHPQRVERLLLYGAFAHRTPALETAAARQGFEAAVTLMRTGWGQDSPASRQFFTAIFMPDADTPAWQWFTEMQRASAFAETAAAFLTQIPQIDVKDLLPQVKVPTLVIHRRRETAVPFDRGRELASLIPGARFLPLEGQNHAFLPGEVELEKYFEAIGSFLQEGHPEPVAAEPVPSGLVTIMFTDMEGSTTLTQRLGDASAQEVLRTHNSIVRDALKACGGSQIKHTGDGIMATFRAASKALECAIAIQKAFEERNRSLSARGEPVEPRAASEEPIRVRIGLNAGEPVAEDEDLFGAAVQLAARVCAHAQPGQILVANVVRELAAGKGVMFSDRGDVTLRGFEEPARLYEVRWQADSDAGQA